jgi:transcriptional regulator with XRE-family HTH domain
MPQPLSYFVKNTDKVLCVDVIDWVNPGIGECWIWKLSCDGSGRPAYTEHHPVKSNQSAARALWKIVKNPNLNDPKVFLCHNCPNKLCINPDHLYEGNAKTNRIDEVNRRLISVRKLKGHEQTIIRLFMEGVEQQEIAKRINVCPATIQRFLNGQMLQHTHNYVKEAEEIRNALIKKLYDEGKTICQISLETKVPNSVILEIVPEIRNREKAKESETSKLIKQNMTVKERNTLIRQQKQEGVSVRELAINYGCSAPLIYSICKK